MKRAIILLAICLYSLSQTAFMCECISGGPFLKLAPATRLVSLVSVKKFLTFKDIYGNKTPMSMEVEVIDIYKGSENRQTFTVWGNPGHLCRPYLSVFKEGQAYVIALSSAGYSDGGGHIEKSTDYSINNCGSYWLLADLEKKTVQGDINSENSASQSMSLDKLKSQFAGTK